MRHADTENKWREIYFTPEQWACVPASAQLGYRAESDQEIDDRLRAAEEVGLIIQAIMVSALTPRQREVVELYYLENMIQVEVASALGITQATVSQHLKGKMRAGKSVGRAARFLHDPPQRAVDSEFSVCIQVRGSVLEF
jgi:RNA polymerase sigma factor (sigma-70 family)